MNDSVQSDKQLTEEESRLREVRGSYDETYGFYDEDVKYSFKSQKGLTADIVQQISQMKNEPDWMTEARLKAYEIFLSKPTPTWGGELGGIDYDDIYYYVRATDQRGRDWEEVPPEIKRTFDRLGIPEAEQKYLQGVSAQYDSESVYHNIRKDLEEKGVIFLDMDSALAQHPELVREYFGTIIPSADNKFAALNTAVWSGGSFIYVPKGVHVEMPLQAYFRINTQNMGQFERTLIIVDEGAYVHYVEGCLPPTEKVSLGDRWVNIDTIRPGDVVMDSNGCEALVKSVRRQSFEGDLITIRPLSAANTFQVTPEHPVLAVKREDVLVKRRIRKDWLPEVDKHLLLQSTPEFIAAGKLERGDFIVFPISKITRENPRYTPDIMALLGYYLAEGSAYVHNKLNMPVVSFSFNEAEREIINRVKTLVEDFTGKRAMEVHDAAKHSIDVRVYSQELMDLCVAECGKYAADKRLSKTMMELPAALQAHLLDAYFEGDGSVHKRKNTMMRASTASEALAWQLQELLARQGYYATINVRKGGKDVIQGREITRRDQYIIYYSPDKQQSEVRRVGDYFLVPIKGIKRIPYEGPVYNFELNSAPNAYLARGFAVHNCTAPTYSSNSLHSAVVEIMVKEGGRCRYTTIQNWSNNVYNLVTKRAVAQKNATMEWVDGNLGCLAEGSTVTIPDGIKPIEALEVGDQVLSYDDKTGKLCFRNVVAKRFSGYQPVHTVSINERKLQVTANHPFYSYLYNPDNAKKSGRYELGYVRADHLKKAIIPRTSLDYGTPYTLKVSSLVTEFASKNQYVDDLTMTRTRPSQMTVTETTTDDIMWLFGYWVGDGNIEVMPGKTENVMRWGKMGFSSPRTDRARTRLIETMTAVTEVELVERVDGVHLAWNSKELVEFFHLNGFEGKANAKRVPGWVWSLPESQRLAFIAGYLDSDGYVNKSGFHLKSVNRGLLEDIASLLVTLGMTPRLHTEFSEPREVTIMGQTCVAHGAHRLTFQLDERFYPYISPALRAKAERLPVPVLQTKRAVGRSNIELSEPLEIAAVKVSEPSAEPVPTWDIEVEGTGNFVSQGFIVHNSKLTMKYPAVILAGEGAHGEVLSIAFAAHGQHQDAGAKITHLAPNTTSQIISKSISKNGGRASYRGLLKIAEGADNVKSNVVCDALLLDDQSRSDTYPSIEVDAKNVTMGHEASVSKVGEDQLFYLMSRGMTEDEANAMVVNGFLEPLVKELPMEYALELNRLIQIQLEGSIG